MNQRVLKATMAITLEQRIDKVEQNLNAHLEGNDTDADHEFFQLFLNRAYAVRGILLACTHAGDDLKIPPEQEKLVSELEQDTMAFFGVLPFPPEYLVTWPLAKY